MINTGQGYLQGLDDGSVECVNDSDSSTARNCRISLTAKISNIEHLAFCIEQDIGGHFAEWKISEAFPLKIQNI